MISLSDDWLEELAEGGGSMYATELIDAAFESPSESYSGTQSAKRPVNVCVSAFGSGVSTGVEGIAVGCGATSVGGVSRVGVRSRPYPIRRSLLIWSISALYRRSAAAIRRRFSSLLRRSLSDKGKGGRIGVSL